MAGDEYDGNADFRRRELGLQIEPPKPRKSHVQDQAADFSWGSAPQKLRCRGEGHAPKTDGREERILYVTPGYRLVALNAKTGASTRSTATLFAMQHGLLDTLEPVNL